MSVLGVLLLIVVHPALHTIDFLLMLRRPPRSTLDRSSAASDVYKRQIISLLSCKENPQNEAKTEAKNQSQMNTSQEPSDASGTGSNATMNSDCLLYTSDAADERSSVDLGGRRIIKKKNTI